MIYFVIKFNKICQVKPELRHGNMKSQVQSPAKEKEKERALSLEHIGLNWNLVFGRRKKDVVSEKVTQ